MFRVLVPVDGSANSDRAVEYLIKQAAGVKTPLDVHVLNVQHPFPGTITGVAEQARQYHQEEGMKVLEKYCQRLDRANCKHAHHIGVGDVGEVVAHFARDLKCDHVVMGTRGMGSVANMLLGSAATKVLHLVDVPVVLVK